MLLAPPPQQAQLKNNSQQSQHQFYLQNSQQNQHQLDNPPNLSIIDPPNRSFRETAIPNNYNNNNNILARSLVPSNFEEILNDRNSFHTERLDFNNNMNIKPNVRNNNLPNNNTQFQMVQSINSIFVEQKAQEPLNRSEVLRKAAANNQYNPPETIKPQNLYDSFEAIESQEQIFPRSSVQRISNNPSIAVHGRYALPADIFISDKNQSNITQNQANNRINHDLYDYVKLSAQLMAEKEFQYFSPSSQEKIKNPQTLQRNRGIYEGETVKEANSTDQILQGRGKMLIRNGDIYIGEFWRNSFHGNGLLAFSNGDFYEGKFAYNQMNGKGIYHFFNGDQFKGEFVEDKFSGDASEYSEALTGEVYIGQFLNGLRHGKGKLTSKTGQVVDVEYFKGKRLISKFQEEEDEKVKKAHQMKQQEQQKQQLQQSKRPKIFKNEFYQLNESRSRIVENAELEEFIIVDVNLEAQSQLNQYELILKNTYPANDLVKLYDNGSIFEGSNHLRLTSGIALFIFPDGNSYAGEWEHGLQQGQGMYFDRKVGLFTGSYVKGKKHGYGEMRYLNGDLYKGNWVDDHKESEKATYYSVEKQLKSIGRAEHGQFIEVSRQQIKCVR